jgi:outer membrane lipoprotein-sorting protein
MISVSSSSVGCQRYDATFFVPTSREILTALVHTMPESATSGARGKVCDDDGGRTMECTPARKCRLNLMMQLIIPILSVFACTLHADSNHAEEYQGDELATLLKQLDEKVALISDLTADYQERKFLPFLKEPLTSMGTLYATQDASKWENRTPSKSTMVIGRSEVRIYYIDRNVVEVFKIDQQMRRLTVSALPNLSKLKESFDMETIPLAERGKDAQAPFRSALRLRPITESLKKHVSELRLLIDTRSGVAVRVEWTAPEGDRTVLTFSKIRLNQGLANDDLALKVPVDAKITHPLGGG